MENQYNFKIQFCAKFKEKPEPFFEAKFCASSQNTAEKFAADISASFKKNDLMPSISGKPYEEIIERIESK